MVYLYIYLFNMKAKYKKGIENYEHIAIYKADGTEIIYNPPKMVSLKQFLTKRGVVTDTPLDHFTIIPNPYKDTPKCHCRLCDVAYKDVNNTSGQLTLHIQNVHSTSIPDYLRSFPEEASLFSYTMKGLSQKDPTITPEDSRIQCPICHKYFKAIKASHTKTHGMTLKQFREHTGLSDLASKASKERAREVYRSNVGLINYKKPSKPKPVKVKKNKSQASVKQYVSGVDYPTYDTNTLLKEGAQFIYKITSPSGRCYIGRTSDFFHRMTSHKASAKTGSKLTIHAAIRKYGWENMIKEIIDIRATEEEIKVRERYWIDYFDSYYNGYNSTECTDGGHSWEGKKDTQQYRDYVANAALKSKGKKYSGRTDDVKKRLSAKSKGRHTLKWFQDKYGELEGQKRYDERSEMLRNRKDLKRDSKGRFYKAS